MSATLTFQRISNGTIFLEQFNAMTANNTISFNRPIAVVYAPNGTGKSSFAKVLGGKDKATAVAFSYEGQAYTKPDSVFHIINDQNSRNIIEGDTQDFVLGDNIRREIELARLIAAEFEGKGTGIIEKYPCQITPEGTKKDPNFSVRVPFKLVKSRRFELLTPAM